MSAINDTTAPRDTTDETMLVDQISDEALETAAGMKTDKFTLPIFMCTL